ncbi:MAG: biotin/lipoyl-binding protein [Nanoarchaeota archaeon]|nr:biotin/lipoyl-binding protein [Nanoarchaeota archaeon]MBU1004642.1 biotin/lipoyl-binding protein [Nanoarchaeota archaeon]MBU1946196.1 biotin/lipoyl-binding protein [Nanoarchaeota archaeon]
MQDLKVNIDGKEYTVKVDEIGSGKLMVYFDGESFEVETKSDIEKELFEQIEESSNESGKKKGVITAPLPGIVFSIDVKIGEKVVKGKKLMSLMAMKMENEIIAHVDGKVKEIKSKKGDTVNKGDILLVVD